MITNQFFMFARNDSMTPCPCGYDWGFYLVKGVFVCARQVKSHFETELSFHEFSSSGCCA